MTVHKIKNKKIKLRDNGFTMIELVAVLTLTAVVFIGASIAISTFLLKFQELQRISVLNREAFNCMQVIKHGINVEVGTQTQFMGVINADEVELGGNYVEGGRTSLFIKPPEGHSEYSVNDEIKIFLSDGYVRYDSYVYGSPNSSSKENYIFPKRTKSKNRLMEVTSLIFRNGNPLAENVKIVKVELEARVEISRNKNNNRNYHTVRYETFMAIGKM